MDLLNQRVCHKVLGNGVVIAQSEELITVQFASKVSKFKYPHQDTFVKFLQAEDASVQRALLQEVEDAKRAAEVKRLAEEKRKAEEASRNTEQVIMGTESKKRNGPSSHTKEPVNRTVRISGKPMTFYVFQGNTFDIESRGGFIWAPKHSKGGGSVFHWDNLSLVKKGDIVLHGCNACVVAVSRAVSDCYDCERPKEQTFEDSWNNEGRRVDLDYQVFDTPIRTADYIEEILQYCRVKYSPFDRDGNGNMGYLYELNSELARVFLEAAIRMNPYLGDIDYIQELLTE